jgi:hypothetical protein
MMDARDGAGTPGIVDREHLCAVCGRFISASRLPADFPMGLVQARAKCQKCGKWRWYDVADGAIKE